MLIKSWFDLDSVNWNMGQAGPICMACITDYPFQEQNFLILYRWGFSECSLRCYILSSHLLFFSAVPNNFRRIYLHFNFMNEGILIFCFLINLLLPLLLPPILLPNFIFFHCPHKMVWICYHIWSFLFLWWHLPFVIVFQNKCWNDICCRKHHWEPSSHSSTDGSGWFISYITLRPWFFILHNSFMWPYLEQLTYWLLRFLQEVERSANTLMTFGRFFVL